MVQCERAMYRMADISNELMNDDDLRHLPFYAGVSVTCTHPHVLWIDILAS